MNNENINLGILGCAKISTFSIFNAVKDIPQIKIFGIASSSMFRAIEYANKYNIPKIYNSYEDLINSNDIDCVYIPLTNDLHYQWSLESLNAKKHVLVEKPAALNNNDFKNIMQACIKNKVHLLEGIMTQYHPWQKFLMEINDSKKYGKLKKIKSVMNFMLNKDDSSNYRLIPEKGGGVFYDQGVYWLQFLQCFKNLDNIKYHAVSKFKGPNNCDWTFDAEIIYKDGLISEYQTSFEKPFEASHELEFEYAVIKIPDFMRPYFGYQKIKIEINDLRTGLKNIIIFNPENYFVNQLKYFISMLNENININQLEKISERIYYLEKIYNYAKNNFVLNH